MIHQARHFPHGMVGGVDHVINKGGVIPVLWRVLHQKRQLGNHCFEVVNHKGGGLAYRLELHRPGEPVLRIGLGEQVAGLAGNHLDQVKVLPIQAHTGIRDTDQCHSVEIVAQIQRNDQPSVGGFCYGIRYFHEVVGDRV